MINLKVEFLSLPQVARLAGGKSIDFAIKGQTLQDLISELSQRFGNEVGNFLLDESGKLDSVFRIQLNKTRWIPRDRLDTPLQDGDRVTFMMLVAGG